MSSRYRIRETHIVMPMMMPAEYPQSEEKRLPSPTRAIATKKYRFETLNPDQSAVYRYTQRNPRACVVIQAGPGTGKTHTLLSMMYGLQRPITTIIYKHDLLACFRYNSKVRTVASFTMKLLGMSYMQYKTFDRQLSYRLSCLEFMNVIVAMLKSVVVPELKNGLVILDEYTIIPKPILMVILVILEYYGVGTVICGDRNQLQNINNSNHAHCSSYVIASQFADKVFNLSTNERCSDPGYNAIVDWVAQFSSDRDLDRYAFAVLALVFMKQVQEGSSYHDTHLAGTHAELAQAMHSHVALNNYAWVPYYVDVHRSRDLNEVPLEHLVLGYYKPKCLRDFCEKRTIGKFLPYLPLVPGALYYVCRHSEHSRGVLRSFDPVRQVVVMDMEDGSVHVLARTSKPDYNKVIFEEHLNYLCDGLHGVSVYNFPIYPANYLTIHKCQGCTISEDVSLLMGSTNYQALYVAISRVRKREQMRSVRIPEQIKHLVSAIINVPAFVDPKFEMDAETLADTMTNYKFYHVEGTDLIPLIVDFMMTGESDERRELRQQLIARVGSSGARVEILNRPQGDSGPDEVSDLVTINKVIQKRHIFLGLSRVSEFVDRTVWLREYMDCVTEMKSLSYEKTTKHDTRSKDSYLVKFTRLDEICDVDMSTPDYIKKHSQVEMLCPENAVYVPGVPLPEMPEMQQGPPRKKVKQEPLEHPGSLEAATGILDAKIKPLDDNPSIEIKHQPLASPTPNIKQEPHDDYEPSIEIKQLDTPTPNIKQEPHDDYEPSIEIKQLDTPTPNIKQEPHDDEPSIEIKHQSLDSPTPNINQEPSIGAKKRKQKPTATKGCEPKPPSSTNLKTRTSKQYVIEVLPELNEFNERCANVTTPFCHAVYCMHSAGTPITEDWLLEQLEVMLKRRQQTPLHYSSQKRTRKSRRSSPGRLQIPTLPFLGHLRRQKPKSADDEPLDKEAPLPNGLNH